MVTHNWEGTNNPQLFPEEQMVWSSYMATQLLRPTPERWSPCQKKKEKKESQRGLYQKTYQAIANWKQCLMGTNGLTMTNPWAQLRGGRQKTQLFNVRGLLVYLQSCSLKVRLLIKHTARGLSVILTRDQGRWWVPSLALPLPHHSHQYSQVRSLRTEQPDFCGWHIEKIPLIA